MQLQLLSIDTLFQMESLTDTLHTSYLFFCCMGSLHFVHQQTLLSFHFALKTGNLRGKEKKTRSKTCLANGCKNQKPEKHQESSLESFSF